MVLPCSGALHMDQTQPSVFPAAEGGNAAVLFPDLSAQSRKVPQTSQAFN